MRVFKKRALVNERGIKYFDDKMFLMFNVTAIKVRKNKPQRKSPGVLALLQRNPLSQN